MSRQTGLTLIEMVVVLMILIMLIGVLVPLALTGQGLQIETTLRKLDRIRLALRLYYYDQRSLPAGNTEFHNTTIGDNPTTRSPYISTTWGTTDDAWDEDAWHTTFVYAVITQTPPRCTIRSFGPDKTSGGGDDIVAVVNLNDLRLESARIRTADTLTDLNTAVDLYYQFYWENTLTHPKFLDATPGDYNDVLNRLIIENLIPNDARYLNDSLGAAYQIDPNTVSGGIGIRIQSPTWPGGVSW